MKMREGEDRGGCMISVILPVYNAMPWLPISVRDMLKQVSMHDANGTFWASVENDVGQ